MGRGITTGSARSNAGGNTATGPNRSTDAVVNEENRLLDRKLKGICRGC
jgi:hypothetical protein